MRLTGLDHLVLTVASIPATVDFYSRVLGMTPVAFGAGRTALAFGGQKINLHETGREISPHAANATPGSADLCLIAADPLDQVADHLAAQGVAVLQGPVERTGARGPIRSLYIRDLDGNLLEISNYIGGI